MYGFFETQFGVRMLKAQEKLRAVAADDTAAALLGVPPGAPLLAVDRVPSPMATGPWKCAGACAPPAPTTT
jgi:DNA-binding GntR family transcriptional regulator